MRYLIFLCGSFRNEAGWIALFCWFCFATMSIAEDAINTPKRAYTDVKNTTKLFSHIVHKEWKLALERTDEEPGEAAILIERKDQAGILRFRQLPLQQVFIGDLPQDVYGERSEMPEEQLQLIKTLFRLNPRAAIQRDLKKRTLLHLAVASQVPPPVSVINAFIKVYPQALRARDENDRFPLHSAVASPMTTFANVEAIVNAFPEAIDATDADDALPLHLAAWGGTGPDSLPVLELLVNKNPEALSLKDGDEETVLMLMAKYGRTSPDAIAFVLQRDPEAIFRDRDEREGSTPLHYAVSSAHGVNSTIYAPILKSDPTAAEKIDKLGRLPIHVALSQCCVSFELIKDLIQSYPLSAALHDGEGFTPLHHACQAGVSDIEIVKLLLETAPKSVQQYASLKGSKGPMPLHLALESQPQSEMMDKLVSILLKEYPDAARVKNPDTNLASLPSAILAQRSIDVLRKLMLLDPDSIATPFEAMEEGEPIMTSSLHLLASLGPTYLNGDDMETIVKYFLSIDPDGATRKDDKGRTPLHIVWKDPLQDAEMKKSRTVFSDVVLAESSDAVKITDGEGRPPVAYACVQRDDVAVNKMLNAYSIGAAILSSDGSFPLHFACGSGQVRNEPDAVDRIIKRLLQEYPKAASSPNNKGELPFHKICESAGSDHNRNETIVALLEAYPEASEQEDGQGNLPLTIAVNNAVKSDEVLDSVYMIDLIKILVDRYPAAILRQDKLGRTPFLSAIHLMDSLSYNRRQENDPVLEILKLLYEICPQSALGENTSNKTVLHVIAEFFGDVGGMLTTAWLDFALCIMRDYPQLVSQTDKNKRTPLHMFILFLGDTAVGARDNQDPKTRILTTELEDFLHTLVAIYPEALDLREEYGLTPFDLITHKRLILARGTAVYENSPIIIAVKQMLHRDTEYWEMARYLELAKISLLNAGDQVESTNCYEIQTRLSTLQQSVHAKLQNFGSTLSETVVDDDATCPDETQETQSNPACPDEMRLLRRIYAKLKRLGSIYDTSYKQ